MSVFLISTILILSVLTHAVFLSVHSAMKVNNIVNDEYMTSTEKIEKLKECGYY